MFEQQYFSQSQMYQMHQTTIKQALPAVAIMMFGGRPAMTRLFDHHLLAGGSVAEPQQPDLTYQPIAPLAGQVCGFHVELDPEPDGRWAELRSERRRLRTFDKYTDLPENAMVQALFQVQSTIAHYQVKPATRPALTSPLWRLWDHEYARQQVILLKSKLADDIRQQWQEDENQQQRYTLLLQQISNEVEQWYSWPVKQYQLLVSFELQLMGECLADMPEALVDQPMAQLHYGIFNQQLARVLNHHDPQTQQQWSTLAVKTAKQVSQSAIEHSLYPSHIDADIRRHLLPSLLSACKTMGYGMTEAQTMVDLMVRYYFIDYKAP